LRRCEAIANFSQNLTQWNHNSPTSTQRFNPVKTKGIHHVAIICSDYEKSKHFYVEVLGFPVIQETFRAARKSYKLDLKVSETEAIELFSFPDPPERPSRPEACGLRHLAFAVDDIDATIAYLQSRGVTVEAVRLDELTGKRFTFFQDPDGLPLEVYEG
jgi:glyoxylase I family protein